MEWYDALWVGEKASKKKHSIIDAANKGNKFKDAYLIILSPNPSLLLEIVPVDNAYIHPEQFFVIGIALGKAEAFSQVEMITDYIWRSSGSLDLKAFFRDKGCLWV